jgi:hypothetical protein
MELDKIIETLKEKDIDGAVITAIKGLDQTGEVERLTKELESEQGKSKGILDDKRKYKDRAELAEKTLKDQEDSKLPAEELHKKQLQELEEKYAEEKRLREEDAEKVSAQTRENELLKLAGSIKWAKSVPQGTAALLVKNAFDGIDDLSDASKVSEVVKSLTESHASFITADAPGGTGGREGGTGATGGSENKAPSIAANQQAIWGNK